MNNAQNWVEALKINPETLAEWSAQVPDGQPLLLWCLTQQKISNLDYMAWASEHFALPVLDNVYFETQWDTAILNQARAQSEVWNSWFFPIAHWDDVSIIACVEPPIEPLSEKAAFVLVDPAKMQQLWSAGDTSQAQSKDISELDAPVGVNLNASKKYQLNLEELDLAPPAPHRTATRAEAEPFFRPPPPSSPSSPSSPLPLPLPLPEDALLLNDDDLIDESAVPPTTAITESFVLPTTEHRTTAKPITKLVAKQFINPQAENAEFAAVFQALHPDFQGAVVLRCASNLIKAYRWSSEFNSTEVAGIELDVNYPSFLRIVAKTLQPYHGYVIDSPVHQDFFKALGLKEHPACVTAIPLKVNTNLWGILVAVGNELAQEPQSLHRATLAAEKLIPFIEALTQSSAAA